MPTVFPPSKALVFSLLCAIIWGRGYTPLPSGSCMIYFETSETHIMINWPWTGARWNQCNLAEVGEELIFPNPKTVNGVKKKISFTGREWAHRPPLKIKKGAGFELCFEEEFGFWSRHESRDRWVSLLLLKPRRVCTILQKAFWGHANPRVRAKLQVTREMA